LRPRHVVSRPRGRAGDRRACCTRAKENATYPRGYARHPRGYRIEPPPLSQENAMELNPADMTPAIHRLKRAQGHLAAVTRMHEQGRDCKGVGPQLSAVSRARDRAGFAIVASGMEQCMTSPDKDLDRKELEKLFLTRA